MKYILVSGGVISGIGKGVIGKFLKLSLYLHAPPTPLTKDERLRIASSTGLLLKTLGFNVTAIKIDPYMNIDAGTMSPTEHGKSLPSLLLSFSEE